MGVFFNYSVPDLNEEPPVEYSYGTIDLNAEPNADVGFDSQASYGFVYDDSKQSNPEEAYEEKPAASNVNRKTKEAAVRVEEDTELTPDTEFSFGGQHFEMSIERFAVHLGLYYEPKTVLDDFGQGLTQGEEGVMRAWCAQISNTSFIGHRVRAMMIRDPLIRYIHRCIVTTISGVGDYDRSLLSALTPSRQAVQPGMVFPVVLRLLLPPSGALYTVGWGLHHPHCPDQRHG
ncbi:hypothetical protein R6Q57_021364 [Mikania cordata]